MQQGFLDGYSLWQHIYSALLMMIPVVVGGVLHMVVVTNDWFVTLKKPLHKGFFGANKTWRGFVVMPIITMPGALLLWLVLYLSGIPLTTETIQYGWPVLGLLLGFAYVLFELPNSFIKRRMGAAPGEVPAKGRLFYVALDQIDSGVGATVFYYLFFASPATTVLCYAILFPLVALVVKRFLFMAKLKKSYT